MKEKMKLKRLLSILLTLVMVAGMLPDMSMTAFAAIGSGTEANPYIVTDYDTLRNLMMNTPDDTTRYIKLGSAISYSESKNNYELKLKNYTQSVVLDLNGYEINRSGTTLDDAVIALDFGNLTIRDSSSAGTGKIVSNMNGDYNCTLLVSSGNLTIESGTFEINNGTSPAVILTMGGTTQIKGGNFINKKTKGEVANFESGIVTVDGGTFDVKYGGSGSESYGIYIGDYADVILCSCTVIGGTKAFIYYNGTKIPDGCSINYTTIDDRAGVVIKPKEGSSINTLSATVTKPVHGNLPEAIATTGDTSYTVTIDRWYESDGVNVMQTGDTFVGGKTYVVQVKFTPKAGYIIRADRSVTINGVPVYFCASESSGGSVVYRAALTVPADIVKVVMTSNLTTPGIGGAVTTPTFTINEGNPVYVSNGKWEKYDDTLSKWSNYSGKTFEAGKYRYAAQLSLKSEDYENYLMNEDVTVTVDGKIWNIDNKRTWDNSDKLVQCMAYSTEYNVIRQYTVSFNANGGTGSMEAVTTDEVLYNLPANGFTAPEGKQFKGWAISADGTVISGTTIDVTDDTTLYAIWEDIPVAEYAITVTDGKATESAGTEISKAAEGTTVTLTANAAPEGKVFDKWEVESGSITLADANGETTTFTMPASAVSVKATYKSAPHTHSYADTWNKDANKHWKSCACGEKSYEAAHTAGDWIVDVEATETTVGSKHKECSICGYKLETAEIPVKETPHTHSYGDTWNTDADKHWKSCTCGEKKDEAVHTAGDWIVDKESTTTEVGSKHKECSVCGYKLETAEIPVKETPHTHSYGDTWNTDADKHWKSCACGEKKDEAVHTAGDWIVDKEATETTVGSKHKECIVCGYIMETAEIPKIVKQEKPTPKPAAKGKVIKDKQGISYKVTKSAAKNGEVTFVKPKSGVKGIVKIPDTVTVAGITYKVTAIEANAFKNNANITKVIIGNNVTVIGKNAFAVCINLSSVTVGKKVKTISSGAFSGCAKLKTVKLGAAVTSIGDKAFYKCTSLTGITIPAKVTKIGKSTFEGCKKLKTITVKSINLKSVGSRALKGIYAKAKIKVPKSKLTKYKSLFKNKGQSKNVKVTK